MINKSYQKRSKIKTLNIFIILSLLFILIGASNVLSLTPSQERFTFTVERTLDQLPTGATVGLWGTAMAFTSDYRQIQNTPGNLSTFASTEEDPAIPLLQKPLRGNTHVDAAKKDDTYVVLNFWLFKDVYDVLVRSFYEVNDTQTFSITDADCAFNIRECGDVRIKENGTRFAVAYRIANGGATKARIYDINSTSELFEETVSTTNISGGLASMDLKADYLVIGSTTRTGLFNATSGSIIFNKGMAGLSVALDEAGKFLMIGTNGRAEIFEDQGSGFVSVVNITDSVIGSSATFRGGSISDNGETGIIGAYSLNSKLVHQIGWHAINLSASPPQVLWIFRDQNGTGGVNRPYGRGSVQSEDGKWMATSSAGARFGGAPEFNLFNRNSSTPFASLDTTRSIFDVDMSHDGQFIAIATFFDHESSFTSGGNYISYDRGGQRFSIHGTPALNRNFTRLIEKHPNITVSNVSKFESIKLDDDPESQSGFVGLRCLGEYMNDAEVLGLMPDNGTLVVSENVTNSSSVGSLVFEQSHQQGPKLKYFDNCIPLAIFHP